MRKRRWTTRCVSLGLCLVLCIFQAPAQVTYAQSMPQNTLAQTLGDVSSIIIPEKIGKVQQLYSGTSNKSVILIQDAHAIPAAQLSIKNMIDYFQQRYGISLVGAEGASSKLDGRIFKSFPEKELLMATFKNYMKNSELTGLTAAVLFNPNRSEYHGIENWALYLDGTAKYLEALQKKEKLTAEMAVFFAKLQSDKQAAYSPELLKVDRAELQFYENKLDLLELLKEMSRFSLPPEGSELELLLAESRRDEADRSAVEIEVKKIAEIIGRYLRSSTGIERAEKETFNRQFQLFQTARLEPEAFAIFMKELIQKHQIPVQVSRKLSEATGTHQKMRDIKGTTLFSDLEDYVSAVKEKLIRDPQQKMLNQRTQKMLMIQRFIDLEINQADWTEIQRINRTVTMPDRITLSDDLQGLFHELRAHIRFYEIADERDRVFFEKTKELMRDSQKNSCILIAGGFHTEGLTQYFKKEGISYVLLMPSIPEMPAENLYQDHMRGRVSWRDYFEVKNGKINLYEAFTRAARDVLLAKTETQRGELLKLWRDQIIRDLAEEGRLADAGKYTKFIDEAADEENDFASLQQSWFKNIDSFIEKIENLRGGGTVTAQAISGALNTFTSVAWVKNVTQEGAFAPADFLRETRFADRRPASDPARFVTPDARESMNPFDAEEERALDSSRESVSRSDLREQAVGKKLFDELEKSWGTEDQNARADVISTTVSGNNSEYADQNLDPGRLIHFFLSAAEKAENEKDLEVALTALKNALSRVSPRTFNASRYSYIQVLQDVAAFLLAVAGEPGTKNPEFQKNALAGAAGLMRISPRTYPLFFNYLAELQKQKLKAEEAENETLAENIQNQKDTLENWMRANAAGSAPFANADFQDALQPTIAQLSLTIMGVDLAEASNLYGVIESIDDYRNLNLRAILYLGLAATGDNLYQIRNLDDAWNKPPSYRFRVMNLLWNEFLEEKKKLENEAMQIPLENNQRAQVYIQRMQDLLAQYIKLIEMLMEGRARDNIDNLGRLFFSDNDQERKNAARWLLWLEIFGNQRAAQALKAQPDMRERATEQWRKQNLKLNERLRSDLREPSQIKSGDIQQAFLQSPLLGKVISSVEELSATDALITLSFSGKVSGRISIAPEADERRIGNVTLDGGKLQWNEPKDAETETLYKLELMRSLLDYFKKAGYEEVLFTFQFGGTEFLTEKLAQYLSGGTQTDFNNYRVTDRVDADLVLPLRELNLSYPQQYIEETFLKRADLREGNTIDRPEALNLDKAAPELASSGVYTDRFKVLGLSAGFLGLGERRSGEFQVRFLSHPFEAWKEEDLPAAVWSEEYEADEEAGEIIGIETIDRSKNAKVYFVLHIPSKRLDVLDADMGKIIGAGIYPQIFRTFIEQNPQIETIKTEIMNENTQQEIARFKKDFPNIKNIPHSVLAATVLGRARPFGILNIYKEGAHLDEMIGRRINDAAALVLEEAAKRERASFKRKYRFNKKEITEALVTLRSVLSKTSDANVREGLQNQIIYYEEIVKRSDLRGGQPDSETDTVHSHTADLIPGARAQRGLLDRRRFLKKMGRLMTGGAMLLIAGDTYVPEARPVTERAAAASDNTAAKLTDSSLLPPEIRMSAEKLGVRELSAQNKILVRDALEVIRQNDPDFFKALEEQRFLKHIGEKDMHAAGRTLGEIPGVIAFSPWFLNQGDPRMLAVYILHEHIHLRQAGQLFIMSPGESIDLKMELEAYEAQRDFAEKIFGEAHPFVLRTDFLLRQAYRGAKDKRGWIARYITGDEKTEQTMTQIADRYFQGEKYAVYDFFMRLEKGFVSANRQQPLLLDAALPAGEGIQVTFEVDGENMERIVTPSAASGVSRGRSDLRVQVEIPSKDFSELRNALEEWRSQSFPATFEESMFSGLLDAIKTPSVWQRFYVAKDARGKIIGVKYLGKNRADSKTVESYIYIDESARGKGAATTLNREAFQDIVNSYRDDAARPVRFNRFYAKSEASFRAIYNAAQSLGLSIVPEKTGRNYYIDFFPQESADALPEGAGQTLDRPLPENIEEAVEIYHKNQRRSDLRAKVASGELTVGDLVAGNEAVWKVFDPTAATEDRVADAYGRFLGDYFLKVDHPELNTKEIGAYRIASALGVNTAPWVDLTVEDFAENTDFISRLRDFFEGLEDPGVDLDNLLSLPALLTKNVKNMSESELAAKKTSGIEEILAFIALTRGTDFDIETVTIDGVKRYALYDLPSAGFLSTPTTAFNISSSLLVEALEDISPERLNRVIERFERLTDEELTAFASMIEGTSAPKDEGLDFLIRQRESLRPLIASNFSALKQPSAATQEEEQRNRKITRILEIIENGNQKYEAAVRSDLRAALESTALVLAPSSAAVRKARGVKGEEPSTTALLEISLKEGLAGLRERLREEATRMLLLSEGEQLETQKQNLEELIQVLDSAFAKLAEKAGGRSVYVAIDTAGADLDKGYEDLKTFLDLFGPAIQNIVWASSNDERPQLSQRVRGLLDKTALIDPDLKRTQLRLEIEKQNHLGGFEIAGNGAIEKLQENLSGFIPVIHQENAEEGATYENLSAFERKGLFLLKGFLSLAVALDEELTDADQLFESYGLNRFFSRSNPFTLKDGRIRIMLSAFGDQMRAAQSVRSSA